MILPPILLAASCARRAPEAKPEEQNIEAHFIAMSAPAVGERMQALTRIPWEVPSGPDLYFSAPMPVPTPIVARAVQELFREAGCEVSADADRVRVACPPERQREARCALWPLDTAGVRAKIGDRTEARYVPIEGSPGALICAPDAAGFDVVRWAIGWEPAYMARLDPLQEALSRTRVAPDRIRQDGGRLCAGPESTASIAELLVELEDCATAPLGETTLRRIVSEDGVEVEICLPTPSLSLECGRLGDRSVTAVFGRISEVLPVQEITLDVELMTVGSRSAGLEALVDSAAEAERLAEGLRREACFQGVEASHAPAEEGRVRVSARFDLCERMQR